MKRITTLTLAASLALMPFEGATTPEPDIKPQGLVPVIAGCAILITAGVAVYVVYRVDRSAKKAAACPTCNAQIPEKCDWCPTCGAYHKCPSCDVRLAKGEKVCHNCEEKIPTAGPIPNVVEYQMEDNAPAKRSAGGVGIPWRVAPQSSPMRFGAPPEVISLPTWEAFDAYVSDPDVISYHFITSNTHGLFRVNYKP